MRTLAHTTETILPDLSQDVVIIDGWARLIPRSSTVLSVPLEPGTPVLGLRLPVAATDVRLDPSWSGWREARRSGQAPTTLWDSARAQGALSWATDPRVERFLRLLDVPGIRVDEVAARLHQSERTLRRWSMRRLGVSPVVTRGLLRDWRFLREIHNGSSATAAATKVGFADVAHASRELKRFAGGEPGWMRVRLAD